MPQDKDEYEPEMYTEDELEGRRLEVPTKYLAWRSHPSAKKRGFPEITKDMVLANLSENDMQQIRILFSLYRQNCALVKEGIATEKEVKSPNNFLEGLINFICNSSVGFKGFGRSLDTTMIQLKEIKKEDLTKKGKWSFRGR